MCVLAPVGFFQQKATGSTHTITPQKTQNSSASKPGNFARRNSQAVKIHQSRQKTLPDRSNPFGVVQRIQDSLRCITPRGAEFIRTAHLRSHSCANDFSYLRALRALQIKFSRGKTNARKQQNKKFKRICKEMLRPRAGGCASVPIIGIRNLCYC